MKSVDQLTRLVKDYGVKVAPDNASAVKGAEVVVLAVKPQHMRAVALGLAPHLRETPPLLISVAAGIPHAALARWFGPQIPVIRTMPNRPALNGFGATGLYAPASVGAANRALAEMIMAAVSATVWVEHESQMDTVTALSGSGPAYVFHFIDALTKGGVALGLPEKLAHDLALQTVLGSAELAAGSKLSPLELAAQVKSPRGTTLAGCAVLEEHDALEKLLAKCLAAAKTRAEELARGEG